MPPLLSTTRLSLALIAEHDHPFILNLLNTKGWLYFIGNRNVHTKEEAIAYIRKMNNTPDLFYWVVRLRESNTPIGIVSFMKRSYLQHFDIGFAFLPAFNGQGYAFEAAQTLLNIAVTNGYEPVLATLLPQNSRSIKLLTKLGFHFQEALPTQSPVIHVYSNSPIVAKG